VTAPDGDDAFSRWLADRTGRLLQQLRLRIGHADPTALGDAADAHAHTFIVAALARWRPGDAVLSEEAPDDRARLTADRVWIVDPLDGTREYTEPGSVDWAVHIGLWKRPVGLSAGAVALPAQGRTIATDAPPSRPGDRPAATPVRLAVSRTRRPGLAHAVAAEVGASMILMGSAGAKVAAVVTGEADAYLHVGGQYEWDSAAPVAVAVAAGLHASRVDGTALVYNRPDPRLPDLLVCRPDLAPALLAAVERRRRE
jgi:3'(2'), 5'-bisphosphate nucleotidase